MSKENMGRNAEHYADPTPTAAISDLKIYDQPRELRVFTGLQSTRFGMRPVEITRPPQSWRYVEELSNE